MPAAAVHAGVVKDGEWAIVKVKFVEGMDQYKGSEDNGVRDAVIGGNGG